MQVADAHLNRVTQIDLGGKDVIGGNHVPDIRMSTRDTNMSPKNSAKKLKAVEARAREPEAQLAHLQAQNKRTSSPQEALKVAGSAKKTSAEKQKKVTHVSSSDDSAEDELKAHKENVAKTIVKEIFPTSKFVKGQGTLRRLCHHVLCHGKDAFGALQRALPSSGRTRCS